MWKMELRWHSQRNIDTKIIRIRWLVKGWEGSVVPLLLRLFDVAVELPLTHGYLLQLQENVVSRKGELLKEQSAQGT